MAVRVLAAMAAMVFTSGLAAQEMVVVPAGPFTMGSNDGPEAERPAHQVDLPLFQIDCLPVTNADFALFLEARGAVAGNNARYYDFDDSDARIHRVNGRWTADAPFANHPAIEPSWLGAREYCLWRGKRLPTEAEWEKAARGTDARRYPWGNTPPGPGQARFDSGWTNTAAADAHPAGASPYGALDMAGNGWEWVSSLYQPYPYRADDGRENPTAAGARGTRGGGADSRLEDITTTQRGRTLSRGPTSGHHNIGFRCVR